MRITPALAGAALSALVLAGCGASPSADASMVVSGGATGGPAAPAPDRTRPAKKAPDLPAPAITPVKRRGASGRPAHAVPERAATQQAAYDDGVVVQLGAVTRGVTDGRGPGELSGVPMITVPVTVRNGARSALDVGTAVVSARYTPAGGGQELAAEATYPESARDLSGRVGNGSAVTTRYSFLVPENVAWRIVVDLDADHAPAVFHS